MFLTCFCTAWTFAVNSERSLSSSNFEIELFACFQDIEQLPISWLESQPALLVKPSRRLCHKEHFLLLLFQEDHQEDYIKKHTLVPKNRMFTLS